MIVIVSSCNGPQQGENEYFVDSVEQSTFVESNSSSIAVALPVNKTKPVVYAYVENSGSMNGYVGTGEGSDFRNIIFNYLTDIKIADSSTSMHLNFVNSKIIPSGSAVDDFVKKLNPTSFRVSGGNCGATDIAEIIKRVYPKDNAITVLVSDCIVSPGKGKNASEYLAAQQTGIKGFIKQQKKLNSSGIIVYRMLGRFKGDYYDTIDNKQYYEGIRPFYIWVIGDVTTLKDIRCRIEPKMKSIPDHMCVMSMGDPQLKYNIVPAGGKYRNSHNSNNTIENVKKMKTKTGKRVVIKLNANYSNMLQDSAYLADISNYQVDNPSYRVDNVTKMRGTDNYVITISSPIATKGTITVSLKNKMPQWVELCTDRDGGFPNPQDRLQKTYGLSYLIGGVYDAYTFDSDNLAKMTINIK